MKLLGQIIILFFLLLEEPCFTQDNGAYIYGSITTDYGDVYTGFMRWGKEEMYWHDIFNSTKTKNFKPSKQEHKENNDWRKLDWNLNNIWRSNYQSNSHSFACFFGDIDKLKVKRSHRVEVVFKNGSSLDVQGGSNDIGTSLFVYDNEIGQIKLHWDDIDLIDFFQAPDKIKNPYGKALFGTIKTDRRTKYTGYIKWDLDERQGNDILDGDSHYGDQKIPFEKIGFIQKNPGGNSIKLSFNSGRTIKVSGSNDCNDENRGIAVYVDHIGSIEIAWEDFNAVQFLDPETAGPSYNNFYDPKSLKAKIHTFDGDSFEGFIAFDKDEIWNLEFLDGNDDEIEYQIPIRNISKIIPKNKNYSLVYLKNGEELLLGDRQDVSYANDGILIFKNNQKDPTYLEWDEVDEIIFLNE